MRALLSLFVLALGSTAYAAAIPCVPASVDVYRRQAEGCTVGLFTLKNFAWSSVDAEGYVPVSAADVFVTPSVVSNQIQVSFNSDAFSVTGFGKIRALLDYTIDPPPPILDDLNLEMDANSPVWPGYASITADLCIGGLFSNSCANGIVHTLFVEHLGDGNPTGQPNKLFDSVQFPQPVNVVDVRTTIVLEARGESSQINGYGTTTTALPNDEVPEPATAALMLSGLAGAVYFRSRRRRS